MNKFIALAAAGAIAVTASLATIAPSQAWYHGPGYGPGPVIGAGVLGFAFGAMAANAYGNDHWYHGGHFGGPGWDNHVQACEDAYRSYDPRTDTYVRLIHGRYVRVQCDL